MLKLLGTSNILIGNTRKFSLASIIKIDQES